ncbi:MAG: ribosome recycling factor [Flavobacteriales bacterium]
MIEEEVKATLAKAEDVMKKAIERMEKELVRVRANKASASMIDGVRVDYYGSMVPISQVANINTPDARTISVQPWEKGMLTPIAKAITDANLGLNPQNNGDVIIISIPPLTEERRKALVKQCKTIGEDAKVSIRQGRKEANESIKAIQKKGLPEDAAKKAETSSQEVTNKYSALVDKVISDKEKEIMTV